MQADFTLKNRVAVVTGGAQGIGLAIVEEILAQGGKVVVVDNGVAISGESAQPDEVVRKLSSLGGNVAVLTDDVAAPDTASKTMALAIEKFGAVDVVVNNAAILRDGFIFKGDRAQWERVIATNLTGAWAMLAAATPLMRDSAKAGRSPGRIVNIISTAGLYGNFGQAAYASAKAALVALTRVCAMDMARSKVNCNAVAPFASTRVTQSIQPANEAQAQYKERALQVPTQYVAKLVAWLASPGCEVTGQVFGVRGREAFLFSQPRPVARVVTAPIGNLDGAGLDAQLMQSFQSRFTDLSTDLEAFNSEPVL
jgi:NAD(P)-dependent dehydrogenase (short-subunit alcohol dehydrogenase family)